MSVSKKYAELFSEQDPEFKEIWEDEERKELFDISTKIIELRLELGLNQSQFAQLVGVKQPFISRLENGEQNITFQCLHKIINKAGAKLKVDVEIIKNEKLIKS